MSDRDETLVTGKVLITKHTQGYKDFFLTVYTVDHHTSLES